MVRCRRVYTMPKTLYWLRGSLEGIYLLLLLALQLALLNILYVIFFAMNPTSPLPQSYPLLGSMKEILWTLLGSAQILLVLAARESWRAVRRLKASRASQPPTTPPTGAGSKSRAPYVASSRSSASPKSKD